MATLSVALAETVMVPPMVDPFEGEVKETVGAEVSVEEGGGVVVVVVPLLIRTAEDHGARVIEPGYEVPLTSMYVASRGMVVEEEEALYSKRRLDEEEMEVGEEWEWR